MGCGPDPTLAPRMVVPGGPDNRGGGWRLYRLASGRSGLPAPGRRGPFVKVTRDDRMSLLGRKRAVVERSRSAIAQTHARGEDRHGRPRHVENALGHERDDDAANAVRRRRGSAERVLILEREAPHAVNDRLGGAAPGAAARGVRGEIPGDRLTRAGDDAVSVEVRV